ncbi:hypothetical protein ALC57_13798 [Trachymyrmex cornetzi]|uniref:Uncharacterized protein n=1 Tax=Trachymyrmex cornetzi TaxID=471704 RepID=A0A151IZ63_9HYME|nr:hypothetical protein ALC57_13798 [Trachymyrmex cornetzi]
MSTETNAENGFEMRSTSLEDVTCLARRLTVNGRRYNCSTMSTTMLTRSNVRIRRRPTEPDKATKRIVVKAGVRCPVPSSPPTLFELDRLATAAAIWRYFIILFI